MAVTVAVGLLGASGCGGRHSPERVEKLVQWRVDDALDELDATPAQRERVQALAKEQVQRTKPLVEQAQRARTALIAEWKAPTPDAAKAHQLVDAQLDSVRSFAHGLVDAALEVRGLLTPTQREQISKHLDQLERRAKP
jgi:Spy/CpxP family protein refolding chaperone